MNLFEWISRIIISVLAIANVFLSFHISLKMWSIWIFIFFIASSLISLIGIRCLFTPTRGKVENILKIEFYGIWIIGFIGISLTIWASYLSTKLVPDLYDFEIGIEGGGELKGLDDFLLSYDFPAQKGTLRFKIVGNVEIKAISIDFFSFINNETIEVNVFEYINNLPTPNGKFKLKYVRNPVNNSRFTTFVIKNINNLNLSNKYIVIHFESNIEPKGIFTIYHPGIPIFFDEYAIFFNLGNRYECEGDCLDKEEKVNIEEHLLSDNEVIKLRLLREGNKDWHRFKIGAQKKIIFRKTLFEGLGISLLGSAIILLFKFGIDRMKEKIEICPLCLNPFKSKRGLRNHIRRVH